MRLTVFFLFIFQTLIYAQESRKLEVYFERGNIKLNDATKDSINAFLLELRDYRITLIDIKSYCDEESIMLFNRAISERRAKSVHDFIREVTKFSDEKIPYKGFGRASARNANGTEIIVYYISKESVPEIEIKKTHTWSFSKDSLLAGRAIRLNLNFYPGKAVLLPKGSASINELAQFLNENPGINIEIDGHVCCNNNLELSVERAFEVYEQLLGLGINATRLSYKGFGNSKPLRQEISDIDREINRRVEIKLKK